MSFTSLHWIDNIMTDMLFLEQIMLISSSHAFLTSCMHFVNTGSPTNNQWYYKDPFPHQLTKWTKVEKWKYGIRPKLKGILNDNLHTKFFHHALYKCILEYLKYETKSMYLVPFLLFILLGSGTKQSGIRWEWPPWWTRRRRERSGSGMWREDAQLPL